ncbi:MAG: zf-HC2 domain-containing protein [Clostridia bacterium]|nr:zf-HC2 domain-containing protein [Clostridia bacterium]
MSNNRSCQKYDRMIDDYIDGLLSEKDTEKLEAHLAECEDCRASLRFSLALREMTRASAERIPQDVHNKILAEAGARGRRRQLIRRGALSVACALIFVASVAAWAMLPGRQKTEDVPPENDPIVQVTDEDTKSSLQPGSIEEPETDVSSPMPEIQGTVDNTYTAEEEQIPNEPEGDSAAEMTEEELLPETMPTAETAAKAETVMSSASAENAEDATDALPVTAPMAAESLGKDSPDGEDITLALLIVSGLLAVASFIAFLISLSSVRRIPSKKDKE